MKIFALAKYNQLSAFMAQEGNPLPEENTIVIGATEAEMMKEEKLISGAGSRLRGFFGINTVVGGILAKTGQPIDMMHFPSPSQFGAIVGKEGVVFSRLTEKGEPKMFFVYDLKDKPPFELKAAEGSVRELTSWTEEGGEICPVVVGAGEAGMMRSEKLFSVVGDRIEEFFGNNVEIVAVLEETNSSIDMFHFVSPDCEY